MMRAGLLCLALTMAAIPATKGPAVPAGSTVYIQTQDGFDIYLQAAMQAKRFPVRLVSEPERAEYVLATSVLPGSEETGKRGERISEATFRLTSKSGDVVWAYVETKGTLSPSGRQSVAEDCAKHMRDVFGETPDPAKEKRAKEPKLAEMNFH